KPACISCFCSFFASVAEGGSNLFNGEASRCAISAAGRSSGILSVGATWVVAPSLPPSRRNLSVAALCGLLSNQYTPSIPSEMHTKVETAISMSIIGVSSVLSNLDVQDLSDNQH